MNDRLWSRPSALAPLVMSLIALVMVLVHASIFGIVNEADEGTLAHIFQILMIIQLPIAAYFLLRYLPTQPKQASKVIALQASAWITAIASVLWLT